MMGEDSGYESFLREELEKLYVGLVQKHQAELGHTARRWETRGPKTPQGQGPRVCLAAAESDGSPSRSHSVGGFPNGLAEMAHGSPTSAVAQSYTSFSSFADSETNQRSASVLSNWTTLTSKLIEATEDDRSDSGENQQMSYVKDILALRAPWKVALQHRDLKREKTKTFSLTPAQLGGRVLPHPLAQELLDSRTIKGRNAARPPP
jgi:hypothetical protein